MFIDEARICVVGGRGGHGCVSFRPVGRDPHKRRPIGGNGGRGGNVILMVSTRMRTLFTFTKQIHWKAEHGVAGGTNSRTGKSGKHCVVKVPLGTVVKDLHTQEVIADLARPGQKLLIARGGMGGRGNEAFMSNRFKAPRISELGERGEEQWLKLELKMLADVGIIGFPNAGKSTLLSRISAAKPKVAAYPFTTLEPQLGIVYWHQQEFVAVDIPGLIEGAHQGKGLGDRFLKHVERTRLLVHLVDLANWEGRDSLEDFHKINHELEAFSPVLAQKPQIVFGTKVDLLEDAQIQEHVQRFSQAGIELLPLSAVSGAGVDELMKRCVQGLSQLEEEALPDSLSEDDEERVYGYEPETGWTLVAVEGGFSIEGPQVKRLGLLRLDTKDALVYLHEQLERLGVLAALAGEGAKSGDTIFIGENAFEYGEGSQPTL